MRSGLLLVATISLISTSAWAEPSQCEKTIFVHGFASRAQFQCGFSKYSNQMMADAAICNHQINDDAATKRTLIAGMTSFDNMQKKVGGLNAACKKALVMLPNLIHE